MGNGAGCDMYRTAPMLGSIVQNLLGRSMHCWQVGSEESEDSEHSSVDVIAGGRVAALFVLHTATKSSSR